MNGTNLFKIAFRALANNKLRAFLTMLGIIIGVASVITMLAIGQGSKKSIQAQISEMGSNMIMIHPGADMRGGVRQDPSAMQTLKLTDYEALRNETNFLAAVSPNVSSSGQLIAGNNNYPSSVSGRDGRCQRIIRQVSDEAAAAYGGAVMVQHLSGVYHVPHYPVAVVSQEKGKYTVPLGLDYHRYIRLSLCGRLCVFLCLEL